MQELTSTKIASGCVLNDGTIKVDEIITTANVASYAAGLGVGQTWQDVTASRSLGVTYTNTTGKPIQVIIYVAHSRQRSVVNLTFKVGTVDINATGSHNYGWDYGSASISITIPNGASYTASTTDADVSITSWVELR